MGRSQIIGHCFRGLDGGTLGHQDQCGIVHQVGGNGLMVAAAKLRKLRERLIQFLAQMLRNKGLVGGLAQSPAGGGLDAAQKHRSVGVEPAGNATPVVTEQQPLCRRCSRDLVTRPTEIPLHQLSGR